jgi:hypothetical protein
LGSTDDVQRQLAIYDDAAAEPFHVLHMGPMSDDAVSNQLLSPEPLSVPSHATFWAAVGTKFGTLPQNLGQYRNDA